MGKLQNGLNLPQELAIKNINAVGKTYYLYSAGGQKLQTVHKSTTNMAYTPVVGSTSGDTNFNVITTTDYVGNKVYENGTLKRVLVDGGYIEGGVYHYYLNDHLGNNRMIVNQNGVKTQWNHYYPFGMAFAEGTVAEQGKQPYKYNGKELDQMHGLNLYDYSARYYEPAIGRFTTVDPMAEKYYSISPYAYCNNNPLRYIDPTGMYPDSGGLTDNRESEKSSWQKIIDQKTRSAELAWLGKVPVRITSNASPTDIVSVDGEIVDHISDGKTDIIHLSTRDVEVWGVMGTSLNSKYVGYNYSGLDGKEHIIGPSLILLGQPIKALKPYGALGSKPGSSIASYTLSKAIPTKFTTVLGKNVGTKVATKVGTNVIGRAIGRSIPYIGWYLTAADIGYELGQEYGGDAWVRWYKNYKKEKEWQEFMDRVNIIANAANQK